MSEAAIARRLVPPMCPACPAHVSPPLGSSPSSRVARHFPSLLGRPAAEAALENMPLLAGGMATMAEGEYEAMRAANVKRNQEIMLALGLDKTDFQLHNAHKDGAGKGHGEGNGAKAAPAPRKRKSDDGKGKGASPLPETPLKSTRRSARIRGAAPENRGTGDVQAAHVIGSHRPLVTVCIPCGDGGRVKLEESDELSELHDAAERDHQRWAGKQGKATIVGTASYKHTLHRVMTMSPDALARRIKAIERACGKYAVVKMRLFARVLCLEGHEDLAADATAAYERLVVKLGAPTEEDEEAEAAE